MSGRAAPGCARCNEPLLYCTSCTDETRDLTGLSVDEAIKTAQTEAKNLIEWAKANGVELPNRPIRSWLAETGFTMEDAAAILRREQLHRQARAFTEPRVSFGEWARRAGVVPPPPAPPPPPRPKPAPKEPPTELWEPVEMDKEPKAAPPRATMSWAMRAHFFIAAVGETMCDLLENL